jgi:hypothetical protein
MNRVSTDKRVRALPLLGLLILMVCASACGQIPVDEEGNSLPLELTTVDGSPVNDGAGLLTETELVSLVGPVALYPDDLLAIVLPASTYPLEIVQAARFLENLKEDSSLTPYDGWDDSVVALLNYPEVVQLMNEDINWTWKLGQAVVAQQGAVVAAVESFRDTVYTAGNLESDEYQTVTKDEGIIEIKSVSEKVIYVPYYKPARVVVYSPYPVYAYYPRSYPSYYYPYASDYSFGAGVFWGVTTAFTIGWASDYLHVYHHSYDGHPYYGHSYFGHNYRHRPIEVHNNYYVNNHKRRSHDNHRTGDSWRPRHSDGARPGVRVARNNYYQGALPGGNKSAKFARNVRTDGSGQIGPKDSKSRERIHNSSSRREITTARNSSESKAVRFRSRDKLSFSNSATQAVTRDRSSKLVGRSQSNTHIGRTQSNSQIVRNHSGTQLGRGQSNTQIARNESSKAIFRNQTSKRRESTIPSGAMQRNSQVQITRDRITLSKPPLPVRPVVPERTITSRQEDSIASARARARAPSFVPSGKGTQAQRSRISTETRKGKSSRRTTVKPKERSSVSGGTAKHSYPSIASRHSSTSRAKNSRR